MLFRWPKTYALILYRSNEIFVQEIPQYFLVQELFYDSTAVEIANTNLATNISKLCWNI